MMLRSTFFERQCQMSLKYGYPAKYCVVATSERIAELKVFVTSGTANEFYSLVLVYFESH